MNFEKGQTSETPEPKSEKTSLSRRRLLVGAGALAATSLTTSPLADAELAHGQTEAVDQEAESIREREALISEKLEAYAESVARYADSLLAYEPNMFTPENNKEAEAALFDIMIGPRSGLERILTREMVAGTKYDFYKRFDVSPPAVPFLRKLENPDSDVPTLIEQKLVSDTNAVEALLSEGQHLGGNASVLKSGDINIAVTAGHIAKPDIESSGWVIFGESEELAGKVLERENVPDIPSLTFGEEITTESIKGKPMVMVGTRKSGEDDEGNQEMTQEIIPFFPFPLPKSLIERFSPSSVNNPILEDMFGALIPENDHITLSGAPTVMPFELHNQNEDILAGVFIGTVGGYREVTLERSDGTTRTERYRLGIFIKPELLTELQQQITRE